MKHIADLLVDKCKELIEIAIENNKLKIAKDLEEVLDNLNKKWLK